MIIRFSRLRESHSLRACRRPKILTAVASYIGNFGTLRQAQRASRMLETSSACIRLKLTFTHFFDRQTGNHRDQPTFLRAIQYLRVSQTINQ